MLRRKGRLCQAGSCRKKCQILRSLKEDRTARTVRVVEEIQSELTGGKGRRLRAYRRQHQCNPLQLPFGSQGELETVFEQLKRDVEKPTLR